MKYLLKVLVGSRAHGLNTENSDFDYRGVYIEPTSEFFRLDGKKPKDTSWIEGKEHFDKAGSKLDDTSWELGHYLNLAVQCNPNILETLVAPVVESTSEGEELRALFPMIWDSDKVYTAFLNYSINQRKKLLSEIDKNSKEAHEQLKKFGATYLRALIQGDRLLTHGILMIDCTQHEEYQTLLMIRNGVLSVGQIIDKCRSWEYRIAQTYQQCPKHKPNLHEVQTFLWDMRRKYWETENDR